MALFRRVLPLVAVLWSLACGGDSNEPRQSLTGTWRGPVETASFTLSLSQTNRDITGNGTLVGGGESVALTATGTATLPNFSINLTAPGFESMNFAGTIGTNQLTGTLNGSGFVNDPVTLTRQ